MKNLKLGHRFSQNLNLSILDDLLLHHWAIHCRVLGLCLTP